MNRIIRRMSAWLWHWSMRSMRPDLKPLRRRMRDERRSHKATRHTTLEMRGITHANLGYRR